MNRGQLVTRTGLKLGINVSSGEGDTAEISLLQDLSNEAVVDVLLRTHCYIERGDMTLQQGVSEYRLDSAILAIDNGRGSTPSGVGPYELITMDQMIDYQSSSPVGSGVRKYVAIAGADLLTVAPAPDTSGEVIRFWYVPRPATMESDDDDPSTAQFGGVPTEYHRALEYYMDWQMAEYDQQGGGATRTRVFGAGSAQKDQYDEEIFLIRKRLRKKQGRGLRGAVSGYPPRFRVGRNDVYPSRY